jgi:hypothetical protein
MMMMSSRIMSIAMALLLCIVSMTISTANAAVHVRGVQAARLQRRVRSGPLAALLQEHAERYQQPGGSTPKHIAAGSPKDGSPHDSAMILAGKGKMVANGKNSFVLPLASPMNQPDVMYMQPWTFGNEKWDPVAGGPVGENGFGPNSKFKNSFVQPGTTHSFPPNTPPEANPSMYIQAPPTGLPPGATNNGMTLSQFVHPPDQTNPAVNGVPTATSPGVEPSGVPGFRLVPAK